MELFSIESMIFKRQSLCFSELTKDRMVISIRLACMFLFLYTAHAKVIDHDRFLKGLLNVHFISGFAIYISWLVPIIEALTFILLLIPQSAKLGLYLFALLMILFTIYIVSALIWEKDLPCLCGGAIEKLTWIQHIWFNLAFILLAIFAIRLLGSKFIFKKQIK